MLSSQSGTCAQVFDAVITIWHLRTGVDAVITIWHLCAGVDAVTIWLKPRDTNQG